MCRLFGFRSILPGRPHRSLHVATNAVAEQSRRHPDGWGIGWFHDDDAYVVKSAAPAFSCPRFEKLASQLSSNTFLVHVRRATVTVLLDKLDHSLVLKLSDAARSIPGIGLIVPKVENKGRTTPQNVVEAEIFARLKSVPDIRAIKQPGRASSAAFTAPITGAKPIAGASRSLRWSRSQAAR